MHALDWIGGRFKRLVGAMAALARRCDWEEFQCGDCERRDRCGLPPDTTCIVKAMQIARDGGRPRRRAVLTQC